MATVSAMEIANKEMKKQYKNIDIDKIEVRLPSDSVVTHLAETLFPLCRIFTMIWKT
jgi:hypothetical protein